jgi:hypothetical protein
MSQVIPKQFNNGHITELNNRTKYKVISYHKLAAFLEKCFLIV